MASKTIREHYGIGSVLAPTQEFIAGVELEVEDVRAMPALGEWTRTEDGSLRNSGYEFISPPLSRAKLEDGFKRIHTTIKHSIVPEAFSDRTSIHVHVNCLDCTPEQVRSIVLWYAMFERVFFSMVEPCRGNNIHCVPLDQTILSNSYRRTLNILVGRWSKYTALNLLPLQTQGTIEFRHMEGHNDAIKFGWWLKTLENLWEFGRQTEVKKSTIEPDDILFAFDSIFKDAPVRAIRGSVLELISDSLIDIKLGMM